MERIINITLTKNRGRFTWAEEDKPVTISSDSISIVAYQADYLNRLAEIYALVFNAQNKRKYTNVPDAKLAWDEDVWTLDSAQKQLTSELEAENCTRLVAISNSIPVGFIVARIIDTKSLSEICGSLDTARKIAQEAGACKTLLWEDAGVLNIIDPNGNKIKGVGTSLYQNMARVADSLGIVSTGRTAPGSNAEYILPKVDFVRTDIQDGKDISRYWLIRQSK